MGERLHRMWAHRSDWRHPGWYLCLVCGERFYEDGEYGR